MHKTEHLTVDDLILFMDREIALDAAAAAEQHLFNCTRCAERLRSLKAGGRAYEQYREQVLEPALSVPARDFARLSLPSGAEQSHRWKFWAAAACICGLAFALAYLGGSRMPNARELLARAAAAPETAGGTLLLATGKQRFLRPAVLEPGRSEARFQHMRALFVQANYNWNDPLSARSFADWRRTLPQKEDSVTSIREPGGREFYRVQTRTQAGILRSASLTLQARTYRATKAGFEFQGEDVIELSEQSEPTGLHEARQAPATLQSPSKVIETVATPEDELRVFAALNAIGADAGEPIDVKLDAKHHSVLVTGMGITATRRKELETAMAAIPNTVVRFDGDQPPRSDDTLVNQPDSAGNIENPAFRQKLASHYGGVPQLEEATGKALDASNDLFARAHSLLLLAREFPPSVEAGLTKGSLTRLMRLRQSQIDAMDLALRHLKEQLLPLTVGASPPDGSAAVAPRLNWQTRAKELFGNARNLDALVSRLLAGSYTDEAGNEMLKQVPVDLWRVESLIRAESVTGNR